MASITFSEIQRVLRDRGADDADYESGKMFVEIVFADPSWTNNYPDAARANTTETVPTRVGFATLSFDSYGDLFKIDIS